MTCNGLGNFERTCRKNLPVCEFVVPATSSGVPTATTSPPASPASGPRSTTQSADLITSRLCSITTRECPRSTRRWNNRSSMATSSKCSPVVGSSKMKRLPIARSEEHTSELQSRRDLVCRLLLEKKKNKKINETTSLL